MARLNCPACGRLLVEVNDSTWRVTRKSEGVKIADPTEKGLEIESDLIWSDFDVVQARADEWRDKGVYDPLPPPPDPPNQALLLECPCGRISQHCLPEPD